MKKSLAKVLQVELRQSHHFLQDYDHKKLQDYLRFSMRLLNKVSKKVC